MLLPKKKASAHLGQSQSPPAAPAHWSLELGLDAVLQNERRPQVGVVNGVESRPCRYHEPFELPLSVNQRLSTRSRLLQRSHRTGCGISQPRSPQETDIVSARGCASNERR